MAQYGSVAIVGVGLIGGSIGLALRERQLASEVIGIGRREKGLDAAQRLGAVDRTTTVLAEGVRDADVVVVMTPVDTIADFVLQAAAACGNPALITDGGSTKASIVAAVEAELTTRRDGPRFVGSHPLAGDHRAGVEFARSDLFFNRQVVVTPTAVSDSAAVKETCEFWRSLGAAVVEMSPQEHDMALAATSHLPHLVAAALAAATPEELLPLAASGWRDTTRIAGGEHAIWRPIFAANRENVLAALEHFEKSLGEIRAGLAGDDRQLMDLLERAQRMKSKRDALGD